VLSSTAQKKRRDRTNSNLPFDVSFNRNDARELTLSRILVVFFQRLFTLGNIFTGLSFVGVDLNVLLPLFWQVVFVKDCFNGAFWDTSLAVNALVRADVKHRFAFVETLYRADDDAIGVSTTVASFTNHMSH
jgi:hypothetical protein